jgi:protein SCO1
MLRVNLWRADVIFRSLAALIISAAMSASHATSWTAAPSLPDVDVKDQDGKSLKFYADLVRGRTVFINFIFTGCTTVCPPQTAILRSVRQRLDKGSSAAKNVLLISISVDPLNDTPLQLSRFAKQFELSPSLNNGWVFVTGNRTDMARLLSAFGTTIADPNEHSSLAWVGNDTQQRWTRTSGLNSASQVAQLLEEAVR